MLFVKIEIPTSSTNTKSNFRFMSIYAVNYAASMKTTVYLTSLNVVGMEQMELL